MRLENKHLMAIDLLSSGMAKPEVSEIVGVSLPTIYNWLKDDDFLAKLTEATIEVEKVMRAERIQRGRAVASEALTELLKRLRDPNRRNDITTRELLAIYKDAVITMQTEVKNAKEELPENEQQGELDTDHFEDPEFRKGLLALYEKRVN